ncbi:hypothetical protein V5O48_007541 [Marasmius crinis-equi]|uniref:F-box domain-containing protein n=1 Tax=Marasmius crinis-equi TaxID=585013 RepID=A0ABR3FGH9_9AGAR
MSIQTLPTKLGDLVQKVPVETWENIFSCLDASDMTPSRRACKGFLDITLRPFNRVIHWRSQQSFMDWQEAGLDGRMLHVPREVTLGPTRGPYQLHEGADICWREILPVLATFHDLSTLTLSHVAFPLVDILDVVGQLSSLRHLNMLNVGRASNESAFIRPTSPLPWTSLRTIKLLHVYGSPVTGDEGLRRLIKVLSAEGLQDVSMNLGTFVDILDSIRFDRTSNTASGSNSSMVPYPSLPSTLHALEVHTDMTREEMDSDYLDYMEYTDILCRWLKGCSDGLQRLSLCVGSDMPAPVQPLDVSNLLELTAPPSFLCGLKLGPLIKRVWVPIAEIEETTPWKLPNNMKTLGRTRVEHLSVWSWDITDTSLEDLFLLCPELKELSLAPSVALTAMEYKQLPMLVEQTPHLVGLSVVQPSGEDSPEQLTAEDHRTLLHDLKASCPSLQYVRFVVDMKYVWDEELGRWRTVGYNYPQLFLPLEDVNTKSDPYRRYFF